MGIYPATKTSMGQKTLSTISSLCRGEKIAPNQTYNKETRVRDAVEARSGPGVLPRDRALLPKRTRRRRPFNPIRSIPITITWATSSRSQYTAGILRRPTVWSPPPRSILTRSGKNAKFWVNSLRLLSLREATGNILWRTIASTSL